MLSAGVIANNVLNHTSYSNYVGVVTSPNFMQPIAANPPRRLQGNVSFRF
ncbi:MAG: hypothetical protein JOZ43_02630, partial [Acidobacteriales bacterium]|nr:hypothetical protein [Terriglobales bacterium]